MRKLLLILTMSLASFSTVHATDTWDSQNNTAVLPNTQQENNGGSTNSGNGGESGLDIFKDAIGGGVGKYDKNIVEQTQAVTSKGTSFLYSFFFGSIGFVIFSKIILSLAALNFEPIRGVLGATASGSSGGGLDGGSSNKHKTRWVSQACVDAIRICEGGGSGGGLDGGSSNNKEGGLRKQLNFVYLKHELFAIICFFVAIILLLLPVGWDIIMIIVEFFYGLFESLAEGLRANIL